MNRPWMPWYVADYLADTQHLTTIEHGAYDLLIMHYWRHGGLPPDDDKLRAITKMTKPEWRRHRGTLAAFFTEWKHKRIDREIGKANDKHERRQNAGRAGGIASANAKQNPSNADSIAQASSSQPQSEERTSLRSVARKARAIPEDWALSPANEEYATSRGWSASYAHSEADRFKNHFLASGAPKKNWDAAWRNWVTSPFQKPQKVNGHGTGSSVMATAERLIAEEKLRSGAGDGPLLDLTPVRS